MHGTLATFTCPLRTRLLLLSSTSKAFIYIVMNTPYTDAVVILVLVVRLFPPQSPGTARQYALLLL